MARVQCYHRSVTDSGLSNELTAFIARHFISLLQLEVLLWLHARPGQAFEAAEIARALRCDKFAAERWLAGFRSSGFLQIVEKTKSSYAPGDKRLTALLDLLAAEYKIRPLKVIEVVVNRSTLKMMDLMKAFQLKKEDEPDDR